MYTLEKVLRVKKDAITHVEFLEEVMKTLDEKPSFTFWTTLAKAFESQTKQAAQCKSGDEPAPRTCADFQLPHGSSKRSARAIPGCFGCSTISSPKSPCIPILYTLGNTKGKS